MEEGYTEILAGRRFMARAVRKDAKEIARGEPSYAQKLLDISDIEVHTDGLDERNLLSVNEMKDYVMQNVELGYHQGEEEKIARPKVFKEYMVRGNLCICPG
jgi:hypothetical protein